MKIKTALGEQKVPLNQIDLIEYDSATPSFTLAESRMNVGAVSEAIGLYTKAIDEAKGKTFVERAAQYGKASALADMALADPGKLDEAIANLGAFIQANGSSRQLGPALESMIQLNLMKGDIARAENALDDLSAKVPTASGRAAVLKARILGKKGEHAQAIQSLDQLISQAPKGSAQSREAMLAKSENLVALKKYPEAEEVVRQVIQERPRRRMIFRRRLTTRWAIAFARRETRRGPCWPFCVPTFCSTATRSSTHGRFWRLPGCGKLWARTRGRVKFTIVFASSIRRARTRR